jgi:hypothetical protein
MVKSMITYEQAKQLARAHIKSYDEIIKKAHPNVNFVIVHSNEFDNGWIFYFSSKLYLETRNMIYRFLGLGPVSVGKEGDVFQTGSGGNEESWIALFNEQVTNQKDDLRFPDI